MPGKRVLTGKFAPRRGEVTGRQIDNEDHYLNFSQNNISRIITKKDQINELHEPEELQLSRKLQSRKLSETIPLENLEVDGSMISVWISTEAVTEGKNLVRNCSAQDADRRRPFQS
jgi:hypothetical protein